MIVGIVTISSVVMAMLLASEASVARRCPHCREDLPQFRKPTSLRQMLWGGWTCSTCGSELNLRAKER
jgi:hypothetical protein